jgi:hypothetical protein
MRLQQDLRRHLIPLGSWLKLGDHCALSFERL